MQSGRSAAAVGAAATSAVVTGIVWIIASDGLFAVVTDSESSGQGGARHDSNEAPHCRQGSHHGLRECGHSTRPDLQHPAGGDLHHYGRQRVRQEHLLRHLIGLVRPAQGEVFYDGERFWAASAAERARMMRRCGVLYQSGALWSSMTLAENVALPLEAYRALRPRELRAVVSLKLALVGLAGCEDLYPFELSGGMRKRAALAGHGARPGHFVLR